MRKKMMALVLAAMLGIATMGASSCNDHPNTLQEACDEKGGIKLDNGDEGFCGNGDEYDREDGEWVLDQD